MKKRYEFKARLWQSITTVLICAAFTLATVGCGEAFHQPKHTGPVTVSYYNGTSYTMERANGEIFIMSFGYEHPYLPIGVKLADVLYEDHDRAQYFVKAVLAPGETLEKLIAREKNVSSDFVCPSGTTCIIGNSFQPQ